MLDKTIDLASEVQHWIRSFETALRQGDADILSGLFHDDSHWRDALALTWKLRTISGSHAIAQSLAQSARSSHPHNFALDHERTPPRHVKRAGQTAIEAFFKFETSTGRGSGVLRLATDHAGTLKAWTLFTALQSIKGHEERLGRLRPPGQSYSRDFRGPNWLDLRKSSSAYADHDPDVIVVGGGQAGLAIAARLKQLDIDTLVVDREERIGDNWRKRYHALTLHNQVQVNHLPYMPFPPNWPTYIPKDKLANWFEAYVDAMELNFWTSTDFQHADYDRTSQRWTVRLSRDGNVREMRPRHVVIATGVSGIPNHPDIPTLARFKGTLLHSSQYQDGEAWAGKRAIVVGTGNSGHDIAQDLHAGGASVTLVQRSPTLITNIEPSAQLAYALYDEGPDLADCDLLAASMPLAVARRSHQLLTEQSKEIDKPLLDALAARGFKLDYGKDDTGWQFKYLTRGGGYYFNVGCSDLVASGAIGLRQFDDIAEFVANGVRLHDNDVIIADLVVLATGYKGQEHLVRRLFGEDVAAQVGPIWGFGQDQELRNMYSRTAQPGLWFIAGSLAQCRINSKYLALQIKAIEAGLVAVNDGGGAAQ